MKEHERYEQIDLPFYLSEIKPILPEQVLDFHAHIWSKKHWKFVPAEDVSEGGKYMVVNTEYLKEDLLSDTRKIFPENIYRAVCFGYPSPAADVDKTNRYTSEAGKKDWIFPLMLAGKGLASRLEIKQRLFKDRFLGYKVLINWFGNDYGNITVQKMISRVEMELADKYRLIVMLHVPGSGRLADPVIQDGVIALSDEYPGSQIVLAHCGRCYLPDQMQKAVHSIRDLPNVYLDTSMVMDPTVIQILLEEIDSSRLLFATDFPVPAMRGRRVYVLDHWVDMVLNGYPKSDYRIQSDDFRASFMVYEIILAIRRAAERVKLSQEKLTAIFHDNGMKLLDQVQLPDA